MTENKRFTLSQNGTLHTVRDNVENKPLGVFEFKDNEFPAYACFHMIIDLMNDLSEENEQLKQQIKDLRLGVLDSIHEADEIQCNCNPCVVEECVKRVVE